MMLIYRVKNTEALLDASKVDGLEVNRGNKVHVHVLSTRTKSLHRGS